MVEVSEPDLAQGDLHAASVCHTRVHLRITAGDGTPYDEFGNAVALLGDTVVVGEPFSKSGIGTGAV
jgi:hypothetical protein